jgi:Ran-binding protein 9/10
MNANGSVPFGSTWRKPAPLPAYSRQFAHIPPYGTPMPPNSFFYPSYLRNSRYVAKLEAAHKVKLATRRESISTHSSNPPSLSTSASHSNVQRIAPSHRGMTYEIVESNPPKEDPDLMPLPSRWSDTEKNSGLELLSDGLELRFNQTNGKIEHEAAAARADYPMSPQCGIYYYEVQIQQKTKEGVIAVGFSTRKASLERLPGWETESWAYHGDDGKTFFGEATGRVYGPQFGANDVIGCGINFNTGQAFFTKNGVDQGCAFREIGNLKPFPCIGMKKHTGACVTVNFGQKPFVFDIDSMMAREQEYIQRDIMSAKMPGTKDPFAEAELVQQLVAHFLAHDGYVETARAFLEEVQAENRALSTMKTEKIEPVELEDDFDATNRQSK